MIQMIHEIMILKKRIKELKKQNERLIVEREDLLVNLLKQDEELQALKEEHNKCTRKHWQSKCAEHCTNEMIYKSRIDKALEYIKQHTQKYDIEGFAGEFDEFEIKLGSASSVEEVENAVKEFCLLKSIFCNITLELTFEPFVISSIAFR